MEPTWGLDLRPIDGKFLDVFSRNCKHLRNVFSGLTTYRPTCVDGFILGRHGQDSSAHIQLFSYVAHDKFPRRRTRTKIRNLSPLYHLPATCIRSAKLADDRVCVRPVPTRRNICSQPTVLAQLDDHPPNPSWSRTEIQCILFRAPESVKQ